MQRLANTDFNPEAPIRRGQKVITNGDEALGEVLGIITRHGASHLHVLRYGPGMDEVFIPTIAVHQMVGDRVYVRLDALDLVGQSWHERPGASDETKPNEAEGGER
jgi:hypothetical protein